MANLMVHNRCNQCCVFCNTQKLLREKVWKETTKEEVKEQLQQAAKVDSTVLFTGGGEVTMMHDLPEMIAYAKGLGVKEVGVETNAVLLSYLSYARMLKQSGLDYCVVSLHSHREPVSDWITQTPGSFKLTLEGLGNLQREEIEIRRVMHTITKLNYRELPEFIVFMRNRIANLNNFGLSFIRPIKGDAKSTAITPGLTEVKAWLHKAIDYCEKERISVALSAGLGVPLCFLEEHEGYSSEFMTYVLLGEEEHKRASYESEKTKGDQCKSCSLDVCCSGLHINYADLYGTSELSPVHKDLGKMVEKWKQRRNIS
jgi:MoaA/NifB/PqqE/SkfB family radical SAM enzyme